MPRKPSLTAHETLDQLRQRAVDARVLLRNLEDEHAATVLSVDNVARDVTEAYSRDDEPAVAHARKAGDEATARLTELDERIAGAQLRVQRTQREADDYRSVNASTLIDERAADATQIAADLTRAGHNLIALQRAYRDVRTDIDALIAAIPGASPRTDGAPGQHAWERQLRDLERVIREAPEVVPPRPHWRGQTQRQQLDDAHTLLRLKREGNQAAIEAFNSAA